LGLTAYYLLDPALAATLAKPDQVLANFIVNVLPVGVAGLVIAGHVGRHHVQRFGRNQLACSTPTMIDFIQRFHPSASATADTDVRAGQVGFRRLGRADYDTGGLCGAVRHRHGSRA